MSTGCGEVLVPAVSLCTVAGLQEGTSPAGSLLPALGSLLHIPTAPRSPSAHPNSFCLWPALDLCVGALFFSPQIIFVPLVLPALWFPARLGPRAVQPRGR